MQKLLGQWEFQIGPVEGIEGRSIVVAIYVLIRLAENFYLSISFHLNLLVEIGMVVDVIQILVLVCVKKMV